MSRYLYNPAIINPGTLTPQILLDNLKTVDGVSSLLDADLVRGQIAVQQGTGPSQLTTPDISLGWDGTTVRVSAGGVDVGALATLDDLAGFSTTLTGAFLENDVIVLANYTITTDKNAVSAGPVAIAAGVTVTVPVGSVWTIV